MDYIISDETNAFAIYGESGCGKTSVIAKLANEVSIHPLQFWNFSIQGWHHVFFRQ
jgi:hypothetical protein